MVIRTGVFKFGFFFFGGGVYVSLNVLDWVVAKVLSVLLISIAYTDYIGYILLGYICKHIIR